jgi:hemerythrin-like domain-containing protein
MMQLNLAVTRRLHEEHEATLALWGRVEQALAAGIHDPALMREAAAALAGEIARHFEFEEAQLFPRLAELLAEEHVTIRAAAQRFIALAAQDPLPAGIKPLALELAERLASHVHKEEMALLPALEDLLDEDADRELALAYAA